MTTPTFVAAGAGATTTGSSLVLPAVSGLSGGERLIAVVAGNGWDDANDVFGFPGDWGGTILGTVNTVQTLGVWVHMRPAPAAAGSDGSVTVECPMPGVKSGRVFAYNDVSGVIVEEFANWKSGTGTTISAPTIVTGGPNALGFAIALLKVESTADPYTGETGSDWSEATAEYAVPTTGPTIQAQTAGWLPGAGSGVSGGSFTASASGFWMTFPLVLIGTAAGSGAGPATPTPSLNLSETAAARIASGGGSRLEDTVDLELYGDMQPHAPAVGAARALVLRSRRRLITRRNTWPWWPDTIDLRTYLLSKVPPWRIAEDVKQILSLDEQVLEAFCTVEPREQGSSLIVSIGIRSSFAENFKFTMSITQAAATLLALEQAA